mgnify:CR=1 FL=1
MPLQTIDWIIVLGYILFTLLVGILMQRRASQGMESFFVGNRSFPWWMVGISMVATTFAADTPLAVTGIIANDGLSGNWFWWSMAFAHLAVVFLIAPLWRDSKVVTDAELIEVRYDGKAAAALRGFKAFFFAVIINCITMGWVIRAVGKIFDAFFQWKDVAPDTMTKLESLWPQGMGVRTANEAISIVLMSVVALTYATLGGLQSVVITDMVQFAMALGGAVLFAWYAVDHVGGLEQMTHRLYELYPDNAESFLSFLPEGMAGAALFSFVMYVSVQWWANHNSDGGGYFAQRLVSARSSKDAHRGSLLFAITHYLVRTWPWVLVGLVALIVYPLGAELAPDATRDAIQVAADREAAYPALAVKLLPAGVLGLLFASLIAAFMSTIDTHVNWGSSYLVNDLYKRFLKPQATEKQLVRAARLSSVLILVMALAITTQIESVKGAWEFFTALGAGLGLPHILRWVWWRISAWSELAGLVTAAIVTALLWALVPEMEYAQKLGITVLFSVTTMLLVTFLAPGTQRSTLEAFVRKVNPPGIWGPYRDSSMVREHPGNHLLRPVVRWLGACAIMVLSLFALKTLFLGDTVVGWALVAASVAGWFVVSIRGSED